MWYEILPVIGILGAAIMLPQIVPYHVNDLLYGCPMRRRLQRNWDYRMFERDNALTGSVWKKAGLENIPDK
ncbi:NADH dehydrogenase [ubiquinone] 1 alpha subcomplex subunit 1-like [Colletes latitarsis]|uniref:NADH dehydrogenase [ubiquinone] 1 alpha subcomplex subunit 1-like n=1 Tax=Colletes latitarsis TaxID=2605962 RepID=UPI004035936D